MEAKGKIISVLTASSAGRAWECCRGLGCIQESGMHSGMFTGIWDALWDVHRDVGCTQGCSQGCLQGSGMHTGIKDALWDACRGLGCPLGSGMHTAQAAGTGAREIWERLLCCVYFLGKKPDLEIISIVAA